MTPPPRSRSWLFWAVTLLVVGVAAYPLLAGNGMLNTRGGGDSPFLLQRVQQLVTAVSDGHFPVRWMGDANYGYGYPFYNFYAPLSIYIAAFFKFLGFTFVQAIQLAQLAGFVVAAAGMFLLARRWFGNEWSALLAAIAYTVAPFHMVNVYVRGDSLAEFWAMGFYPWVLLAADGVMCAAWGGKSNAWRVAVGWFALAYAALILSHNISALIFTPFLLLYLLLRWLYELRQAKDGRTLEEYFEKINHKDVKPQPQFFSPHSLRFILQPVLLLSLAGLLAVGLSAFFVLPALAEKEYTQLGAVTEGYFYFGNHFLGTAVQPAIQSSFLMSYNPDGLEAFRMGLGQALAIGVGVLALLYTWREGGIRPYRRLYIILGLLLSSFMFLPLSTFLWESLPLLDFTQFPWRFLSVQAFVGSLAIGAIGLLPWRRGVVLLTAVLLIITSLGNLTPDYLLLDDADVNALSLAQYEWFSGNIGTTISFEYLPPTVVPRPFTSDWLNRNGRWQLKTINGNLQSAQLVSQRTTQQEWQVTTTEASTLLFPTLYWRGWTAQVDGQTVPISPAEGSGLITVAVPAGDHGVTLQLKRTPLRLFAEIFSLVALFILLFLCKAMVQKPGKRSVALLGGVLALFAVAQLWPQPVYSKDNLTWDFAQMGYLHHDLAGVPFDNGLILERYEYSTDSVQVREPLTITLFWQDVLPVTAELALYSPAINRIPLSGQPDPPPLVAQTQRVNGRSTTYTFTIPTNAPEGLFVPRLLLPEATPLTPSGLPRGPLFLRPILVTDTPLSATPPIPSLDVQALAVTQRDEETLYIQLAWYTDRQLSPNYNLNLRLTDADGQFLQLADYQPGYGYQPSSLWPPGEWVNDWLTMPLPTGVHPFPYILLATLYDVRDLQTAVLQRKLGELYPSATGLVFQANEPLFVLPAEEIVRETAVFGDSIELQGYTFTQTDSEIEITLYWKALAPMATSYTRFVHLIDPTASDQPPLLQNDALPQFNTYPTTQWQRGEIVSDTIVLSTEELPPKTYQIAVGFYTVADDGSFPRLTAVNPSNLPLPEKRFLFPITIK